MDCQHYTVIKVYKAEKRNTEYPYNLIKELVVRCIDCEREDISLLEKATEIVDLTNDEEQYIPLPGI